MLFNSLTFLIFFTIVLLVTRLSPKKWTKAILLVASLIFYIWWYPPYIVVLLSIITLHYFTCIAIENARVKAGVSISPKLVENLKPEITIGREYLVAGVVINMLMLIGFKYVHFFAGIFGYALPEDFRWALPLGISFFTFHTISCSVDVYRGLATAKRNYFDFLFFICYFPQLIAGPILRLKANWYGLMNPRRPDYFYFQEGIYLIFWGLLKKMVIADNLAPFVEQAFANPQDLSTPLAWLGVYAFAVQIYCDFSGYIDTAIGISKIFRIELPKNFDFPYLSRSITEFWRRWHITLSTWLRDYLYIPLGGNKGPQWRTSMNLMITMLLGGLWHGASFNFLIWGGLHGLYLTIEKFCHPEERSDVRISSNESESAIARSEATKQSHEAGGSLRPSHFVQGAQDDSKCHPEEGIARRKDLFGSFWKYILCFHAVCLAWVFFRAKTLDQSLTYISKLFGFVSISNPLTEDLMTQVPQLIAIFVIAFALHLLNKRYDFKHSFHRYYKEYRIAFLLMSVVLILIFGVKQEVRFIYFDF